MKVLITGATGFVGSQLIPHFEEVHVLTRNPKKAKEKLGSNVKAFFWDPMAEKPPVEAFDGVDVVIHLAGESVAEGRWNPDKKRKIMDSRVLGTRHLVEAMAGLSVKPRALISASAIGWYGDRGNQELAESSEPGEGFLAEVCKHWEAEAFKAENLGMRVAVVRIGLVLGDEGGALPKMLLPFKMGVGGKLASGDQWMSWIHIDDLVDLFVHAARTESVRGPINGVAPEPVTNSQFTKALGSALHRPTIFPVPAFALKVAVGEFSGVLLASQKIFPKAAEQQGFEFKHPEIKSAFADLLK